MEYLCRRSDVICVQETRGIATDSAYLPDSHRYFHNLFEEEGNFTSGAGGILFAVRHTLISRLASVRHEVLVRGRASAVHLQLRDGAEVVIVGVHLDPALPLHNKRDFLHRLRRHVDEHPRAACLMIGDWNFICAEDVRLQDSVEAGGGVDTVSRAFDSAFLDFAELWQPHYTFGRRSATGMSMLSRIDWCYTNIPEMESGGNFWSLATLGSLHADERPSDHVPLLLRVARKATRTARRPRLSEELVRTEEYKQCLSRMAAGIEAVEDLSERYECFVDVAHRAAEQARAMLFWPTLTQPALLAEASLRLYSLAKAGKMSEAGKLAAAIPRLERVWKDGAASPQYILALYRQWSEEAVLVRTAMLEKRSLPEEDRRARRSQLRRCHERIRKSRRRQNAEAWYSMDGDPIGNLEEVGKELSQYWGMVYDERPHDEDEEAEFLSYVQEIAAPHWEWQAGQTQHIASQVRDSAPGPDGLSYSWWPAAPESAHDMLDTIAADMQMGRPMPQALNHSVTVTIPKAEVLDESGATRCSADTVRPMALMQCGCKLIALSANSFVSLVAKEAVACPQRGFLAGRRIEECVIGFDGACAKASLRAVRDAAGLLLTFAQAFPSLAHR